MCVFGNGTRIIQTKFVQYLIMKYTQGKQITYLLRMNMPLKYISEIPSTLSIMEVYVYDVNTCKIIEWRWYNNIC